MHENYFRDLLSASTVIRPFAVRLRELRSDFLAVRRTLGDSNQHLIHRSGAATRLDDLEREARTLLAEYSRAAPGDDPTGKLADLKQRLEGFVAECVSQRGVG